MTARHTTTNTRLNDRTGLNLTALAYRPGTTARGWAILSLVCLATTAANAELVMRIDGNVTPSFSQIEFGDVLVGESRQIVVVLRNEGAQDIVFTENPPVQLGGAFADQFTLIQPALEAGNKLSPNGSTALAIRCEPEIEFANLTCQMFIFTSLSASPERLTFRAAGVAPHMEVDVDGAPMASGEAIDLGDVTAGETAKVTVTVTNTGAAPLEILSLDLDGDDTFDTAGPANTSIAPNSSESFDVTYTANGSDADATIMTLTTNDTSFDPTGEFLLTMTASTVLAEDVINDPNENEGVDNNDNQNNEAENVDNNADNLDDGQNEQDTVDENGNQEELNNEEDLNDDDLNNDEQVDDEYNDEANDDDAYDDDATFDDELEEEFEPIAPIGCGLGLGFCSLATLGSLGAMKGRRRMML